MGGVTGARLADLLPLATAAPAGTRTGGELTDTNRAGVNRPGAEGLSERGAATAQARSFARTRAARRHNNLASKPLLSVEEAATLLGYSRATLYRAISKGNLPLPLYKISGCWRIPRRAVERLVEGEVVVTSGAPPSSFTAG